MATKYFLYSDEQIKEKNLFRTTCPQMVRSAAEILDEITDVFIKS